MPDDARPLAYDDLARAMEPMLRVQTDTALDVKRLLLDHVTKQDMVALRTEMREGFAAADTRYTLRELSEVRYAELSRRLDGHDTDVKDLREQFEAAEKTEKEHGFQFGNNVVTWLIALVMMAATLGSLVVGVIALMRTH